MYHIYIYITYMYIYGCDTIVITTLICKYMHNMHDIHICIYEEIFSINSLSADTKIEFAIPTPISEIMFWENTLHKYVDIYAYVHVNNYFTKHNL